MRFLFAAVFCAGCQASFRNTRVDALINGGAGSHPGGFPTFNETQALLDQLTAWNPLFAGKLPVGVSYQCRVMWAYWVSGIGAVDRQVAKTTVKTLRDRMLRSIWAEEGDWIQERCLPKEGQETVDELDYSLEDLEYLAAKASELETSDKELKVKEDVQTKRRGRLLLTSLHHAREPTSLTAPLHTFHYLVGTLADWYRGGDKQVVKGSSEIEASHATIPPMMLEREVLFLPFVNPDGYVAVERTKNQNIRKNQRPTCSKEQGFHVSGLNGVDLNRNYDNNFAKLHNKCDPEEYEGSEPFSESETRAVRRIADLFRPQIALNFHSYGDIWTRPWNCCPDKALNQTEFEVFREIHSVLNISQFGSAPEMAALGYATTGEADDYLLETFGIISLSPEVGPEKEGFYPSADAVRVVNRENTPRTLKLLLKAGPELSVTVAATQCRGGVANTEGSGPSWGFIVFNSGLAGTGPAKLHVDFRPGQVKADNHLNMTLGFYASEQLEPFRSFDLEKNKSSFREPTLDVSIPRKVLTINSDDATEYSRNSITVTIPKGIQTRQNYEVSFSKFDTDKPLPSEMEVCLSTAPFSMEANFNRDDLVSSIARAQCTCTRLTISTAKGGCPFDKKALHFNPQLAPGHVCFGKGSERIK